MDRTEWLSRLERVHARRRDGETLPGADRAWYREARAALLSAAVEIQARSLAGDARRRASIRVARPVQVLLEARGWHEATLTLDLGTGGFAVLLETPPPEGKRIRATLLLPGGAVMGSTSVVDTRASGGLVRVAFAFSEPSEALRKRVEDAMVDGLLEQLIFWQDVLGKLGG